MFRAWAQLEPGRFHAGPALQVWALVHAPVPAWETTAGRARLLRPELLARCSRWFRTEEPTVAMALHWGCSTRWVWVAELAGEQPEDETDVCVRER
jgi:hypothetical protein